MTLLEIPKMMLNLKWRIQNEESLFQGFIIYHNSSKNFCYMASKEHDMLDFGKGKKRN